MGITLSDGANVGTTRNLVEVHVDDAWAAADALPAPLRSVVCSAPFDMDCIEVVEFWQNGRRMGWPVTVLARELGRCLAKVTREHAQDWGPGYPDIPFTPLEPRRHRPARRGRLVL